MPPRHFGDTFKWLLYGDDDTLFFMEGIRKVAQGLDPDMPYALTGNALHHLQRGGLLRVSSMHACNLHVLTAAKAVCQPACQCIPVMQAKPQHYCITGSPCHARGGGVVL